MFFECRKKIQEKILARRWQRYYLYITEPREQKRTIIQFEAGKNLDKRSARVHIGSARLRFDNGTIRCAASWCRREWLLPRLQLRSFSLGDWRTDSIIYELDEDHVVNRMQDCVLDSQRSHRRIFRSIFPAPSVRLFRDDKLPNDGIELHFSDGSRFAFAGGQHSSW